MPCACRGSSRCGEPWRWRWTARAAWRTCTPRRTAPSSTGWSSWRCAMQASCKCWSVLPCAGQFKIEMMSPKAAVQGSEARKPHDCGVPVSWQVSYPHQRLLLVTTSSLAQRKAAAAADVCCTASFASDPTSAVRMKEVSIVSSSCPTRVHGVAPAAGRA